ncbi:hypothetical protein GCM10009605_24570 [Nocardiopsis composta]
METMVMQIRTTGATTPRARTVIRALIERGRASRQPLMAPRGLRAALSDDPPNRSPRTGRRTQHRNGLLSSIYRRGPCGRCRRPPLSPYSSRTEFSPAPLRRRRPGDFGDSRTEDVESRLDYRSQ